MSIVRAAIGAAALRTAACTLFATIDAFAGTPRPPIPGTEVCVGCHAGPAERSYALSKHGVIARLDAGRTRPAAGPRALTCGTCHPVEARTPTAPHSATAAERELARRAPVEACGACHAPRYVAVLLDSAERSRAIGEMKRREAYALVEGARREADAATVARIESLYATLVGADMKALALGLAHQSPDDQWWLGQAAIDGALLRIKGALSEARRDAARTASGKP